MISVCIPTFNRRRFLAEAIDSVMSQDTTEAYEIIVSDNASTDGSGDMVEQLRDSRIVLIRQPHNLGAIANHNECVRSATGDWILFLHDDDLLEPGALAKAQALVRETEVDILLPVYMKWMLTGDPLRNALRLMNGISPSSTLYQRALLTDFPFALDNEICDWEILVQAAFHGRRMDVYRFDLVRRRCHDGQEWIRVLADGSGHSGKSATLRRLVQKMAPGQWATVSRSLATEWRSEELMILARHLHHAGRPVEFEESRTAIAAQSKWRWLSAPGLYIAAEGLLGPEIATMILRTGKTVARATRVACRRAATGVL